MRLGFVYLLVTFQFLVFIKFSLLPLIFLSNTQFFKSESHLKESEDLFEHPLIRTYILFISYHFLTSQYIRASFHNFHPNNTVFVLVPGSSSPTAFYEKVIPLLQNRGYAVHPTALQSAGERAPPQGPATFQEDASFIRSAILTLIEQGKDIVLAMDSYGGFPGTEASKGLSKTEREKEGKKGGIVALAYPASFIPPVGISLRASMGDNLPDSVKNAGNYMKLNYDEDWKNNFSDLPETEAKHYMNQMANHSMVSFSGELTYPGYKFIPVTYLLTENDKIIPAESQREMIAFARGEGVETDSGHYPMLSIPEKTVEVLIGAAKGV